MENNNETKVIYCLTNVDINKRTGILTIREEGRGKKPVSHNVEVSGQLIAFIKKQIKVPTARKYTDVEFTSTLTSPSYDENPLKLVKFKHPNGELKNYYVQAVNDKGREVRDYYNAFNKLCQKVVWLKYKPTQYFRYDERTVNPQV